MNKLICFIKTSLFVCVVIASQAYAFNTNINTNINTNTNTNTTANTNINSTTLRKDNNVSGSLAENGSTPPEVMIKKNKVVMTITNNTDHKLFGPADWFDSGRLADSWEWPESIDAWGGHAKVELYERNNAAFVGCSGYVNYFWGSGVITFAFSNPLFGTNKVGVGVDGKSVWNNMDNHDYKQFTVKFKVNGVKLKAVCSCTGGGTNIVKIDLYNDTE